MFLQEAVNSKYVNMLFSGEQYSFLGNEFCMAALMESRMTTKDVKVGMMWNI